MEEHDQVLWASLEASSGIDEVALVVARKGTAFGVIDPWGILAFLRGQQPIELV